MRGFEEAGNSRDRERRKRAQIAGMVESRLFASIARPSVGEDNIAHDVGVWTACCLEILLRVKRLNFQVHMENMVHQNVIGASRAATAVSPAIYRKTFGFSKPNCPIALCFRSQHLPVPEKSNY